MSTFSPADYDQAYLASDDPRAQSGFTGSAARWEAARRLIAEGIDRAGTLLDVGCANGLLLESMVAWSQHSIDPYGIDFAPGLVALAQRRLGRERIWLADVATWQPPVSFDFVHVRLDLGHLERVAKWGRRVIVSSDGSFRRPQSPRAEPVADRLRALGLHVDGEAYQRSDEHQVELAVAWFSLSRTR